MGAALAAAAGPRTVARYDGPRHALVRGSRALAGPVRRFVARLARRTFWPVAHSVRAFSALAPGRRVAAGAGPGAKRHGFAPAAGRLHRRAGAPGGGGGQKKDSPVGQALGRSRGGFTTKLHLSCDAQGRICALALTGGQAGDCPQAPGLLRSHLRPGQAVLADRAYDAGYVRVQIQQAGATAVIPSKKNRLVPLAHDTEIYKERNHIERAINGLKRFRAVATRFDKRAANYFATCCLVAALTWL
jgi:transposase